MVELTEHQVNALACPDTLPPRIVNPRTKETFVLLPVDEYQRLKDEEYDDSPWTREEIEGLAWESATRANGNAADDNDALEQP